MQKNTLSEKLQPLSYLLFPPICLHCETKMAHNHYLFCSYCRERLLLAFQEPFLYYPQKAALFPLQDVGRALYQQIERYNLLQLIASFVVVFLIKKQWPLPGVIFPEGDSFFSRTPLKEVAHQIETILGNAFGPKNIELYLYLALSKKELFELKDKKNGYHIALFKKD